MPARKGERVVYGHHEVVTEAGIDAAQLDLAPLDEHPDPGPVVKKQEVEADHDPPVGQQVAAQELLAPGPQDHVAVGVLGG
jgi:hypothetical protein